jgi:putative ABC transport system permease protein
MSSVAHTPALSGSSNGGIAARRAVIRWARRMFRRDWRQQVLIVVLLTIAVAAAVASITIVYNTAPADNAEHGSASYILRFDGTHPQRLWAEVASARKFFGTIEVIRHRSLLVPGTVESLDFRAQDPNGPYASGLLGLRRGSYPKGPNQVALTDGAAELLRVGMGDTVALDGHKRTVVGIVENPRKLSDEFALVSPSSAGTPDHVTVLVDASKDSIDSWLMGSAPGGKSTSPSAFTGSESRSGNQSAETLAMFSVGTVFLLLASLIAAAAFAVVAQRRLRQLGMLAAVGATQKHLRLVLVIHGAAVGSIAAVLGAIAGLAVWLFAAPILESGIDHRVYRLSLPWTWIALTVVLAIVGGTAAAWWPGRAVARLPVVLALSGRPPKPRPARHAAILAAALIAVGIASLVLSGRDTPVFIIVGIVATILGGLLLGPPTIRILSRVAGRLSVAPRLALRDLVRYQARSGAALAAVTLALGIAATVAVVASAEAAQRTSAPPNLSNRQIRVYLGPPRAKEVISVTALNRVDSLAASVRKLSEQLGGAAVTPLQKIIQPGTRSMFDSHLNTRVLPTVELARRFPGPSYRPAAQLYVATPAVLRYLGIDPATIKPGTDFLAARSARVDNLVIPSFTDRREFRVTNVQRIDLGGHLFGAPFPADSVEARTPPAFITLNGLRRLGWRHIPGGWLVESHRPLTSDQIAGARDLAAEAGLTIEVRREAPSYAKVIALAIGAGGLLALAILAMTVGLIRGESAGDLRTLTATGATSRIRRTLTATTAGALALLGALLGVAGAYAVLVAMFYDDLGYLSHVPVPYLAFAILGVPLAAAAAGWLLAGREPASIARPVIE